MAYIVTTNARHTSPRGETFFAKLAAAYGRFKLYRHTLAELSQLSDRELADLGLSRHSIETVAHEAAYGM